MKVRARNVAEVEIPERIEPYTRQAFTTIGKEYEVYAVAVSSDICFILVVNDIDYPGWLPAVLVELADPSLPSDWVCNPILKANGSCLFLMGPEFIAKSQEAYEQMVESDADQVDRFWKRVARLEETRSIEQ
jgi:hypothetical protein